MVEITFDDIEVVDRVIDDFTTGKSAIQHLLLNTYDNIDSSVISEDKFILNTINIECDDNSLILKIPYSSFDSDELRYTLKNIGKSVNHDELYEQGLFGFGTLSYLKICDEVVIKGDGEKFTITEEGYSIEETKTTETTIKLNELNGKFFNYYDNRSLIKYLKEYMTKTHFRSITESMSNSNNWVTEHVRIGNKISVDRNKENIYENDYYLVSLQDSSSNIYLNNVPIADINKRIDNKDFSIYLKTDKYINHKNVVTADISPSNLKIKNKEQLINNAKKQFEEYYFD